jgi:acyl-CoA synthetase (AMP-forming)/AMP-acid ligase II
MTIEEQIFQNALQKPDSVALIAGDERVTYTQLWECCLLSSTNVRRKYGLKKGDRIIPAAAANIDFIYAYF